MNMKQIAFVTASTTPGIAADDTALAALLQEQGFKCLAAAWDDPAVSWSSFDLVLIRSCWNYHLEADRFQEWIHAVASTNVRMINTAGLVLWNMNKSYLRELEKSGVAIPDSAWLTGRDFHADSLREILAAKKWSRAVLKPCVSAGAFRTHVITPDTAAEAGKMLAHNFPAGGMILQEFMEVIPESGELSIIFFKGAYSHTVIKKAGPGDFRVQKQFGGTIQRIDPGAAAIAAAEAILHSLREMPLYARVDGCLVDGCFILMELELIEPVLFFGYAPEAADRLGRHLTGLL